LSGYGEHARRFRLTETGVVKKIAEGVVTVECSPTPACEGCSACSSSDGGRTMEAVNRSGATVREGDVVEVVVSTSTAVRASFLVLLLPLALFVLLYFIVQKAAPVAPEGLRVAAGIGGLGAGFGLNLLLRGKHRELPEIVAVKPAAG
jgi:positive regulator of sigma E activity